MYAIVTKYRGPVGSHGSKIVAKAGTRSVTIPYEPGKSSTDNHLAGRAAWIAKHCDPLHIYRQSGAGVRWVTGEMPDGSTVHVPFIDIP